MSVLADRIEVLMKSEDDDIETRTTMLAVQAEALQCIKDEPVEVVLEMIRLTHQPDVQTCGVKAITKDIRRMI